MNHFEYFDKFLGLKIIRLEDELSKIPDVKKWNTKQGIVYHDKVRKTHSGNSEIGGIMSNEYLRRTLLINEINELRVYWKELHDKEFTRSDYNYVLRPIDTRLQQIFGNYEDFIEEANTHENKVHILSDGKDFDSKSEAIMGEAYKNLHIPYKVHVPIVLPDGQKATVDSVMYFPELGIYKFHEHFVMIGDPNYNLTAIKKYRMYIENGLLPTRDILFTYESKKNPASPEFLELSLKTFISTNI